MPAAQIERISSVEQIRWPTHPLPPETTGLIRTKRTAQWPTPLRSLITDIVGDEAKLLRTQYLHDELPEAVRLTVAGFFEVWDFMEENTWGPKSAQLEALDPTGKTSLTREIARLRAMHLRDFDLYIQGFQRGTARYTNHYDQAVRMGAKPDTRRP
jgi:hypothetical protein